MGCATSIAAKAKEPEAKRLLDDELSTIQGPPPKIPIEIGTGVRNITEGTQSVIFLFGGPGSMKGVIIEELVTEFNFVVMTAEDIVLNYLPNKVANMVETTQEIQDLLKTDPAVMSLEWILHLISAKLATSMQKRFLIDIVPNLTSILKVDSFAKRDYKKEMANFERRHQIMFAVNLEVPPDLLAKRTPGILMKRSMLNKPLPKEEERSPSKKNEDQAGDKKEKKSVFSEGADEVDTSRMKRRLDQYLACAEPFLDYFEESRRLISIEVDTSQRDYILNRIRDFFRDYGFSNIDSSVMVVLFAFDEDQIEGLDPVYYRMDRVRLSSISQSNNNTLAEVVRDLKRLLQRSSREQNHLIIVDTTLNADLNERSKKLNFIEIKECYLDYFVKHLPTVQGRPFKKPFRAISSSSNAICLFPAEVDSDLCKTISIYFAEEQPDNKSVSNFRRSPNPSKVIKDDSGSRSDSKVSTVTTPIDEDGSPKETAKTLNSLFVPVSHRDDASFQSISTVA